MNATQDLERDHTLIVRALDVLDALASRVESGDPAPLKQTMDLLSFFRDYADRYHHMKEEDHLFPALEARGMPRGGGPIAVMLHEHDAGRGMLEALFGAAPDLAASDKARARFADVARSYVQLLGDHIHKENNVLFVMAGRLLDGAEDKRLCEAFARSRAATIGEPGYEAQWALIAAMERAYKEP